MCIRDSGVAPLTVDDGSATGEAAADETAEASADDADEGTASSDTTTSFAPSPDSIKPGTGVAPLPAPDVAPEPGTGVAPIPAATDAPDDGVPAIGEGVAPLQLDACSASAAATPPEGTRLTPGTGVAPSSAPADSAGGTGGGDAAAPLPEGANVAPGTGVAPVAASSAEGLASAVLLVTRTADAETSPAQFRVITPGDALADEAEARLSQLSTQAAVALFADFDVDGYVEAVAPRPVHGVCTATDWGITCVSLSALLDLQAEGDQG